MPARPDLSQHWPDPRFDAYRGLVGRLFRDNAEVGLLLVETRPYCEQVGGHLWWTRWGPVYEVLWEVFIVDGNGSDSLVPDEASEEVLRDFDAQRFDFYGDMLRVAWADAEESRRLRASHFHE